MNECQREMVASDFESLAEFVMSIAKGDDSVSYKLSYSLPISVGDVNYFHNGDIVDMVEWAAKKLLSANTSDKEVNDWIEQLAYSCRQFAADIRRGEIAVFVLPALP